MAVETQYNVVKVNELREITVAQGVDELVINDLDSSPLETKKISAENFALSIKDYVLPIASEDILGGIKVGNGLTINPITGVLTNDVLVLDDLDDVIILNAEPGQVLRYNGNQWVNQSEGGFDQIIAGDGLSGGGTEGIITLHVNAGPGLRIENDQVTVNVQKGIQIVDDYLEVKVNPGLTLSGNAITIVTGPGTIVSNDQLTLNLGNGLQFQGQAVSVWLAAGLEFQNGKVGLNLGNGLHLFNNELAVNIGSGLKFTNGVLEGNSILPELNDVEVNNPQDDQILQYDGTDNVWKNVDIATLNLDDLGDVTVSNPEENEALVYTGTHWENAIVRGVNDVVYKKVVNARISATQTHAKPIGEYTDLATWQNRVQITSTNLYLHPYGGSEVGLWDPDQQQWYLAGFNGVQAFPLSPASTANTNYDVYVHNPGTVDAPVLNLDFVAWTGDQVEQARGNKDGVVTKAGDDTRRLMAVVRTTSAGTTGNDLGGVVTASDKAVTPYCYIANTDNLFEVNLYYVFGTSWQGISRPPGRSGWGCPSAYIGANPLIDHPQINFITATDDPVFLLHSVNSGGGSYAASNIGVDWDPSIIQNNNNDSNDKSSFNVWTSTTYTTVRADGQVGFMKRSMVRGKHQLTYWFDSCGGVTHFPALAAGFNVSIKV